MKKLQPQLRFPEFNGDWFEKRLGDLLKTVSTQLYQIPTSKILAQGLYKVVDQGQQKISGYSNEIAKVLKNQKMIVYGDHTTTVKYIDFDFIIGADGTKCLTLNAQQKNQNFLKYIFYNIEYKNIPAEGYKRHFSILKKIYLSLPNLKEQTKIANFLTAVDDKIDNLSKTLDLFKDYKKGMMQRIFSQEIRFKDEDGKDFPAWVEKKLGDVFERVTRKNKEFNKNVLTISAQQGLINQEKYFNKQVASKDLTNYYLLEYGEFAYNKSYSKGYPMGVIKRLKKYKKGVVSVLYICFKIKSNNNADFYEKYFSGEKINQEIQKIAQEGARNHGLLNLGVADFFQKINLFQPYSADEQTKIANFLSAIDEKIENLTASLGSLKLFKKSLLQKMFV